MLKYAKVVNDNTKQCDVGTASNIKFYISIGMTEMDVEKGFDGNWYLTGFAPKQSEEEILKKEVLELERQTGYTRVLREIILATNVSQEVKDIAEKIEKVAIKLRK